MSGNLYAEWTTARIERERALARAEHRGRLTGGAEAKRRASTSTAPRHARRRPVGRAIGAALAQLAWRGRVA